jgi:molybdopterin molybdotransferase
VSDMLRESPYAMVPIEEAQRLIRTQVAPLGIETIDAFQADGRILAETIVSSENIPDLPKSAMDGYAVRAADGAAERQVIGELTAGTHPGLRLGPGEAIRIMTGAPLPEGADAMIPVERTEEHAGRLRLLQAVRSGANVHTIGQDVRVGQTVLDQGSIIGAPEIGLLATLGRTRIAVYRRPRVAVLATGDEVSEPDAPKAAGGVRDSNRYALLAAAREAGCLAISLGIVADDVAKQRAAITAGLQQADLLLTSGGVSMGTRDLIKPILAELGRIHFGRIAFKPGKPTTFATVGDKLVFGLPGYPVSSLVSFEVFVRPALRMLQGDANPDRPQVTVQIAEAIRPSPDRPEYQRVIIRMEGSKLTAHSTGGQGSSRLLSLRGANGLLLVPPGDTPLPGGSELAALLLEPPRP